MKNSPRTITPPRKHKRRRTRLEPSPRVLRWRSLVRNHEIVLRQVHDVAFALVSRWPPCTVCTLVLVNRAWRACVRPVGFEHTLCLSGLPVSNPRSTCLVVLNGDMATVEKLLKAGAEVDGDTIYDNQEASMLNTAIHGRRRWPCSSHISSIEGGCRDK